MIFWVQLCFKSRDGVLYWKITVIEDYRVQRNFEWLQHCFYTTFKNCGPTKVFDTSALYLEQESIHQSSSKMAGTEYVCCYLQIPKEFKEDWKMTIKWWQFSLGQWSTRIPPVFVHALSVDWKWAFDLLNLVASLLYSLIPHLLSLAHRPLSA